MVSQKRSTSHQSFSSIVIEENEKSDIFQNPVQHENIDEDGNLPLNSFEQRDSLNSIPFRELMESLPTL